MNILVVGDSISFGYELSDVYSEPASGFGNYSTDAEGRRFELYPSKLAYPELLAQKLGATVNNLSLIGGSNDRIFRLTAAELIKKKYDLVICSWSAVDRFDFTYRGEDIAITGGSVEHVAEVFPWFKNFITDHYVSDKMLERFQVELITLQAWLKSVNQPYLFVSGPYWPIPKASPFAEYIDRTRFPTWASSLIDWCKELPTGPEGHPLEAGHELIAERLYATVEQLYPELVYK